MGKIPGWLLRHTVQIEPFEGPWDTYGPTRSVRAFVATNNGSRWTQAGQLAYSTTQVVMRVSEAGPVGSRIVLPDGRRGYVSARADHTAPGFPTPDHAELMIDVAATTGASPAGETVILLRRTAVGRDRFGGDRFTTTEVPVTGCSVTLDPGNEDNAGGATTVTTNGELVVPPGTVVQAVDRVRVRGLEYDVIGLPEEPGETMSDKTAGLRVQIRRVTG